MICFNTTPRWWKGIGFSANFVLVMHQLCMTEWMTKNTVLVSMYGDSSYGNGEADKKIPFGDSPFTYGVCTHSGINIDT